MLYTKKFVFTVSLCAMLAVNPVLAVTNPVEAKAGAFSGEVGKVGTVYSDWAGRADSGIAGVRYVNSAVDVAGNAAQWAENHAAAAAQSAQAAATSAAQAANKVAIAQGEDNKNKAMVTNDKGEVYAGYVTSDVISSSGGSGVLVSNASGGAKWGKVPSEYVYASTGDFFTGSVQMAVFDESGWLKKTPGGTGFFAGWEGASGIQAGFTTDAKKVFGTGAGITGLNVLTYDASGVMGWGKILPSALSNVSGAAPGVLAFNGSGSGEVVTGITGADAFSGVLTNVDGAIKWDKIGPESTKGIVGMVPVGSATATEYGQLWIE